MIGRVGWVGERVFYERCVTKEYVMKRRISITSTLSTGVSSPSPSPSPSPCPTGTASSPCPCAAPAHNLLGLNLQVAVVVA